MQIRPRGICYVHFGDGVCDGTFKITEWGFLIIIYELYKAMKSSYLQVGRGGYARRALMTRGLRNESDDRSPVPRSNPGQPPLHLQS